MTQLIQIAGSLCVLVPFVLVQFNRLRPTNTSYLAFNAIGSTTLAVLAALSYQWGFLLLEGVWAIVSWQSFAKQIVDRLTRRRSKQTVLPENTVASPSDADSPRGIR